MRRESDIKSAAVRDLFPARKETGARIAAFNKKYSLTTAGFARMIMTTDQSVRLWIKGRTMPPAPVLALIYLLENSEEARTLLGVERFKMRRKAPPPTPNGQVRNAEAKRERVEFNKKDSRTYFDLWDFKQGSPDGWTLHKEKQGHG